MGRRLSIYGNWSSYDELSDGVPLTEELAMRQMEHLLRLRRGGVRFDAYLMDAFWYDPAGGYRTWRTPNWPDGPARWLAACRENNLLPGLWFTANTLCHLDLAPQWLGSEDPGGWGFSLVHGPFLDDYVDVLDHWYREGVRLFKIDFADFDAAPAGVERGSEREENIRAFRGALRRFREEHPEAILMAFNGFESREYMDRTDRPLVPVIDVAWLEVFDSIYSGDPRPADLPALPWWRSVDIYGDHMTRALLASGIPSGRIDNCGCMAGPTGTCYWRGTLGWKAMLLLTLARGGDLTVFYGDLSALSDEDAAWWGRCQELLEGDSVPFGGLPGLGEPYGWNVGGRVLVVVNPSGVSAGLGVPLGAWRVLYAEGLASLVGSTSVVLGPYQMAVLGLGDESLGFEAGWPGQSHVFQGRGERSVDAEVAAGQYLLTSQIRTERGESLRIYPNESHPDGTYRLSVVGVEVSSCGPDVKIWSGLPWSAVTFEVGESRVLTFVAEVEDPRVAEVVFDLYRVVGEDF